MKLPWIKSRGASRVGNFDKEGVKYRAIERSEKFDKAKRNTLFWSCALIVLMLAHKGEPLSSSNVNIPSGLTVSPLLLGVLLLAAAFYHCYGFFVEQRKISRLHSELVSRYDGNEQERLFGIIAEIEPLEERLLFAKDNVLLRAKEYANQAEINQKDSLQVRQRFEPVREALQGLHSAYHLDTSNLMSGIYHLDAEKLSKRSDEVRKDKVFELVGKLVSSDHGLSGPEAYPANDSEIVDSIEELAKANKMLTDKVATIKSELGQLSEDLSGFDKFNYRLYDCALAYAAVFTAFALFVVHAITGNTIWTDIAKLLN